MCEFAVVRRAEPDRGAEKMTALISAWLGVLCLSLSLSMVLWRQVMNDVTIVIVLWGAAGAMALAGMVLWGLRNEPAARAVRMQRVQAGVAIVLAIAAAAVVYLLISMAAPVPR